MSNSIRKAWRSYQSLPVVRRELVTLGLTMIVAVSLLPLAIWGAGQIFLGDYLRAPPDAAGHTVTGGPLALITDYVAGLVSGSPGHWFVLLGPYLLLLAFRAARALSKT